jgi:catechol 2,3-dioxygenase-like lactoylglutathione lyase family enzyme
MNHETTFKDINPVIPVLDMTAALAFYEDKLGFRKAFDDAARPGDHLEPKPWGSKDFGLYNPDRTALVFYEDL